MIFHVLNFNFKKIKNKKDKPPEEIKRDVKKKE